MIFWASLFAQDMGKSALQKIIDAKIPIVDIRTPAEWKETGILQGAIPIMFYDEKGKYDVDKFLSELNAKVDTSKPFAIICHTGNRTSMVAPFLYGQTYPVIDIYGGMDYATKQLHLKTVAYKK
jgi:rhodanese-related sulfurtransferase